MSYERFDDLLVFLAVARARSFTRAATQLGVSPSALSHTIRALENRIGVRLLTRTTRSVAPTAAGERLLQTMEPRIEEIKAELIALSEFRDKPAGKIRINAARHAAETILWPKLAKVLHDYPDIKVELIIDYGLINIVEQGYDAGVRVGDNVEKDMIAVRISPDFRMCVVGAPHYFANRTLPQKPQTLVNHICINLRLPNHGEMLMWEFERDGQKVNMRVDGQLVFNNSLPMLSACLAGFGLAYLPEDMVLEHINAGRLIAVLQDWCQPFSGYHLYYPSRHQSVAAFKVIVEALRHRE